MTDQRKIVLVILDGLGDLPNAALGDRTPLEAANTPVLDRLAAEGRCALVDPVAPGVVVETHAGTAPLMGLDPDRLEPFARGPIEAAGAGMRLAPGDVALRGNFATLVQDGDDFDIRDRRAGRINEGTEQLCEALSAIEPIDGVRMEVLPQQQHRFVLRMSGPELNAGVTDTDPGTNAALPRVLWSRAKVDGDTTAARTAQVLNRYLLRAHEVLAAHPLNADRVAHGLLPANGVLTRGAGTMRTVEGLIAQKGLRGAVVGGDRAVLGLGSLLGYTPICRPSFTALVDSDPVAKVAAVREALATHDIVWLHYKGTDIASHDMQPHQKRDCIELVDRALERLLGEDIVIGVTADHTTDCNTGSHTADPVPTILHVPGGAADGVTSFSESACKDGALGRIRAAAYLCELLEAAGVPARPADAPI